MEGQTLHFEARRLQREQWTDHHETRHVLTHLVSDTPLMLLWLTHTSFHINELAKTIFRLYDTDVTHTNMNKTNIIYML